MTVAPRRPPLAFSSLEDILDAVRRNGGRVSAARRVVLDALFAADGPVSAEYLAGGLGGRLASSDVSSVYRNLEHLEELGVVRHVHLDHGPGLYTLAGDTEYLVCESCRRVDSVPAGGLDEVRSAIRDTFGFHARFSHFPIVGLCPACAGEAGDVPGAAPETFAHTHGDHVHAHPTAVGHRHIH